jgi:large subunit ribosomal protein L28
MVSAHIKLNDLLRLLLYWGVSSRVRDPIMAKQCEICGKIPVVGRQLSHAHNVRARRFEPNLQTVRASVNGGNRRIRVCTRCIRSNKVTKVA